MNFKKIAVTLAAVSMLTIGTQSAFAANYDERENNDSPYNIQYQDKLNYQTYMKGYLSSSNDQDWFLFTPDSIPGGRAIITLVSPEGYNYGIYLTTSNGSRVSKTWLIDDGRTQQFMIYTQPGESYHINVTNSGLDVNPNMPYNLSVI
ncbi:hypothetical protein [Paenibacillus mucilaginosus]|uniref:Uncharacterized protein n=1 Tax=Paenibacillus mucilaginosus (strain KNP414) TaxID=1036673 RepID=F8FHA8_PAEMK|nr:hypothetical protein [Paenibacillus mucilaginosus]AEI39810.1 hypothetical protein KNP414_01245 [Paenibacillus mucilaginosus KNP414]MCG7217879.1 hypothetical protein [Paenibacillus mucilaginosus]WDM29094.1 hypothetical protein KCX80_08000 [Paenibacillus mucilaginosus]